MTREQADQWIAALRSGNYQQGVGYLRKNDNYCCLGVLCDLYDKSLWIISSAGPIHSFEITQAFELLPVSVRNHFRVSKNGIILSLKDRDGNSVALAELNDHGFTFDQIADLIDYFYEEL